MTDVLICTECGAEDMAATPDGYDCCDYAHVVEMPSYYRGHPEHRYLKRFGLTPELHRICPDIVEADHSEQWKIAREAAAFDHAAYMAEELI